MKISTKNDKHLLINLISLQNEGNSNKIYHDQLVIYWFTDRVPFASITQNSRQSVENLDRWYFLQKKVISYSSIFLFPLKINLNIFKKNIKYF